MYDKFKHPQVRDMAWVATAPPLLRAGKLPIRDPLEGSVWRSDPERLFDAMQRLEESPQALGAALRASRDLRLGNYYERLWHALLDLAPDVDIIGRNITLYNEGVTLGELDLLLRTPDQSLVHMELAIKFYVGRPECSPAGAQSSPHSAWWGPDPRDQMVHKVERLTGHQLLLADSLHLARTPYPRPDFSCAWLQGQLFLPAFQPMAPPMDAEPTGNIWCRQSELRKLGPALWHILPHKQWLAPPAASDGTVTTDQLSKTVEESNGDRARPVMAIREEEGSTQKSRLMCMPDAWPDMREVTRWKSGSEPSAGHA